jgi:hypothetical protein
MLASLLDGMFQDTQDQYQRYLQAKDKPHILDDATVQTQSALHRTQLEDLALYEQQFARWQMESLTEAAGDIFLG